MVAARAGEGEAEVSESAVGVSRNVIENSEKGVNARRNEGEVKKNRVEAEAGGNTVRNTVQPERKNDRRGTLNGIVPQAAAVVVVVDLVVVAPPVTFLLPQGDQQ